MCDRHWAEEQKAKEKKKATLVKAKEKRQKVRERKASSISKLTEKLDAVFSKFVRLRDTDRHGIGYCIDCGERMEWKEIQCGHFISRTKRSTRWDEQNCAAQHQKCNMFMQGRQYEFSLGINARYGEGTADAILARSREERKWAAWELQEMIEKYTAEVKKLEREKEI